MDTNAKLSGPIDLIRDSINIFFKKNNLVNFLKLYSLLIPFQIFFIYQDYFINSQSKILNTSNPQDVIIKYPWFMASIVLVNLLFTVFSFWVNLAGIKTVAGAVEGKNKPLKEVLKASFKLLWPFSLLSILVGLIQFGGFILLVIPGIIFMVWFGFAKFIFVNENIGIKESVKESKRIVAGKFWPVLGRIVVFDAFMIIVQMTFTFIPFGIGSVISPLFGALIIIIPQYLLYKELSG